MSVRKRAAHAPQTSSASPKVAVVTGASRGIGKATARALSARGYAVALLSRSKAGIDALKKEIVAKGGRAVAIACDVSNDARVQKAAKEVLANLGIPDVVVNNAGIVKRAPVATQTNAIWDETLATNLSGAFYVTRAFLPSMLRAKRGRFVQVASISSTLGTANMSAYCASKWGLVGFTKALAEELRGTKLVTMAILPGSVDTDMLVGSGFAPAMTADDVASTIVYLGVDAPSSMNGSAVEMFG